MDSPHQRELNSISAKTIQLEKIENRNKVDIFENAFRKIKEATGVSDVNEVIQKIVSQESTTENLIAVTRENQSKIEALNQLRKQIKAHCEEIKYSGMGGGQHRKLVDSFEDQLSNSSTRLERSRLKYERLSKVIISMKAGVGHLQDKLESFREEIKGNSYPMTDETIAEVLRECELCFVHLNKRIKAGDDEARRAQITSAGTGTGAASSSSLHSPMGSGGMSHAMLQSGLVRSHMMGSIANMLPPALDDTAGRMNTLRPYNQRIDLTAHDGDMQANNAQGVYAAHDPNGGDDNSIGDLEDDELTRDKVKRASSQILIAMDKRKKRPKKKTGNLASGGGNDDDQSVGSKQK
jgi:coiled-coil domain-containing protein 151